MYASLSLISANMSLVAGYYKNIAKDKEYNSTSG